MQSGKSCNKLLIVFRGIIKMSVDKCVRMRKAGEETTNVCRVSLGYANTNFLWKGQAMIMDGKPISNPRSVRGPTDAVRKKFVNERFLRKEAPIDMNQKAVKMLSLQLREVMLQINITAIRNCHFMEAKRLVV